MRCNNRNANNMRCFEGKNLKIKAIDKFIYNSNIKRIKTINEIF